MPTATAPSQVQLPTLTDAASIASYLTTLVFGVIALVTVVHPGFTFPASTTIQAWIGAASAVVAGGAQLVNLIRHAIVTKAAILAAPNQTLANAQALAVSKS